jgi:thiol-disulfide isomerase/thioredoxin
MEDLMKRRAFLTALLGGSIGVPLVASNIVTPPFMAALAQRAGGLTPSFAGATTWLNSPPLDMASLRGKVVLVDFWTYTCINWVRSYPYVRAWAEKYRERGLVVIGVHAPEFSFEKDIDNVRRAVTERKLNYPVAVDNDQAIWRAFDNHYWPALYMIDAQGRLRHHQFGEGKYEQSERILQALLEEAGNTGIDREPVSVDPGGIEAAADWGSLKSPENYLGAARTEGFASSGGVVPNQSRLYAAPAMLRLNHWALAGDWTVENEATRLNAAGGRIVDRFHARDLHLVLTPPASGQPVRFRVRLDGMAPGADHGVDIDAEGRGTVDAPRLYQLVRQSRPVAERNFEIEFLDPGVRAYAFTFG